MSIFESNTELSIVERIRNNLQPQGTSPTVRLHFGGGEAMYMHYSFISECIAEVERIPIRAALGDRPSNLEKLAYELLKSSAYIE